MPLIKTWKAKPLAVKILVCMALGIMVGMFLHQLDRPVVLSEVQSIEDRLEAEGVPAANLGGADSNGNGRLDRDELKALAGDRSLSPQAQVALKDAAKSQDPVSNFLFSGASVNDLASADTDGNGQLGRAEVEALRGSANLSDDAKKAVRGIQQSVNGGRGKYIAKYLAIVGDLFLGLIRAVVVPLVFIAVFVGIAGNEDVKTVKKIGGGILLYFLFTTFVSVSIGTSLAMLIKPGDGMPAEFREAEMAGAAEVDVGSDKPSHPRDAIKGMIPGNLFDSLSGGRMLDIVLFAALFGSVILILRERADVYGDKARMVVDWFEFALEICMTVVRWAMWLAPLGVFGLMADITAEVGIQALGKLLTYALTVVLGLLCLLVFYSIIVKVVGRRSPIEFFKQIYPLQMLAFSTSSSAAVMPTSMVTAEEKLGIKRPIVRFTIPLGATINMDGTALYQAVAAIFLMQVFGVPITIAAVLSILSTAILASIGTPGTPGVGIVVLAGILEANGVPGSGIALIFGIDRLLDMCRTTINVTGDQTACMVMERIAGTKLDD